MSARNYNKCSLAEKKDDECHPVCMIITVVLVATMGALVIMGYNDCNNRCEKTKTICSVDMEIVSKYPSFNIDYKTVVWSVSPERDFEGNITDKKYFIEGTHHRHWNGIPLEKGNYTCYYQRSEEPMIMCDCLPEF